MLLAVANLTADAFDSQSAEKTTSLSAPLSWSTLPPSAMRASPHKILVATFKPPPPDGTRACDTPDAKETRGRGKRDRDAFADDSARKDPPPRKKRSRETTPPTPSSGALSERAGHAVDVTPGVLAAASMLGGIAERIKARCVSPLPNATPDGRALPRHLTPSLLLPLCLFPLPASARGAAHASPARKPRASEENRPPTTAPTMKLPPCAAPRRVLERLVPLSPASQATGGQPMRTMKTASEAKKTPAKPPARIRAPLRPPAAPRAASGPAPKSKAGRARSDEELASLARTDPREHRRIMGNRISAANSKARKEKALADAREEVEKLKARVAATEKDNARLKRLLQKATGRE